MGDMPVNLILGLEEQTRVVIVEDVGQASTLDSLLYMAPALSLPGGAVELANAVNHFAQGSGFSVITDPTSYQLWFENKLAGEDPDAPWTDGVVRLRDHGVPDFATIAAPATDQGRLVFFAQDDLVGLPYRVDVALGEMANADDYSALPLTPLPSAPVADAPFEDGALAESTDDLSSSNVNDIPDELR